MNDFYRTPPARMFPAAVLVHTVQGAEPCCAKHAEVLEAVMGICGSSTNRTPAPLGAQCRNCINEEKRHG